ncbi:unnamed protein product [Agarophyton chilense]
MLIGSPNGRDAIADADHAKADAAKADTADHLPVTYEYLPQGLCERYVLLLAPVLHSGRRCEAAIARLTAAPVRCREDRIVVLSLIVAPQAVRRICSRFGKVRLVVSAIDEGLDEHGCVVPGAGDFATRYFGTD